jgi:hypothetical protein
LQFFSLIIEARGNANVALDMDWVEDGQAKACPTNAAV